MTTTEYELLCEEAEEQYSDTDFKADSAIRRIALYIVLAAVVLVTIFAVCLYASAKAPSPSAPDTAELNHGTEIPVPTILPTPEDTRKKVLLDPGHGGYDPGTAGTLTGRQESDVNLEIALKVKAALEARGYVVMMTRWDSDAIAAGKNEDMNARCAIIERSDADIFISIHQNAFDGPDVCGCEVYYHETKPDSRYLAECIEKELGAVEGASPSRGVKTYGHMLTKFMRYSVLIECGFLTNPNDERMITEPENQEKIAQAIVRGVENFFDNYYKE